MYEIGQEIIDKFVVIILIKKTGMLGMKGLEHDYTSSKMFILVFREVHKYVVKDLDPQKAAATELWCLRMSY